MKLEIKQVNVMHGLYLSPGQKKTTTNTFGKIQEIRIWTEFQVKCVNYQHCEMLLLSYYKRKVFLELTI